MSSNCSQYLIKVVEQDCKATGGLRNLLYGDMAEQVDTIIFYDYITHQLLVEYNASIKCNSNTMVK